MAKKHPEIEELEELEAKDEEERSRLFEATRKVVLASVGAVGLAQDELENFVNRLVKRGEIAEKDARKLLKEATERRRKSARGMDKRMEKQLNKALDWMNIPSKQDIEELGDKISELTAKVEELKKEKVHV
jgi:poly(hydroxyalkanoate) granule-associated protein